MISKVKVLPDTLELQKRANSGANYIYLSKLDFFKYMIDFADGSGALKGRWKRNNRE
jgi:hypothetical protein